jgi:succinate dehydrogenase / fumarate reductase iron-sulfur subunit
MTASDGAYIGPAALMKANRFVVDSRDGNTAQRLHVVGDDHGVFRCHTVFNCSRACPKDLDPAGSIANLKRMAVRELVFKANRK